MATKQISRDTTKSIMSEIIDEGELEDQCD